jgi:hypothetical protein
LFAPNRRIHHLISFPHFLTIPLSYEGAPPLIKAIEANKIRTVAALVKTSKELNALWSDRYGNKRTPLMVAAETGHSEIVSLLIKNGADPNVAPEGGPSALLLASNGGHMAVVKVLVENRADVNAATDKGSTPLIAAAARGHADVVRFLLNHGANPKAKLRTAFDPEGSTALVIAAEEGDKEIVDMILNADPSIDDNERKRAYSLLKEAEGNRTLILGTVLEVSKDFVTVKGFASSVYRFPIQQQTKVVDKQGREISISRFKKGDAVTVAINRDKVLEIRPGSLELMSPGAKN